MQQGFGPEGFHDVSPAADQPAESRSAVTGRRSPPDQGTVVSPRLVIGRGAFPLRLALPACLIRTCVQESGRMDRSKRIGRRNPARTMPSRSPTPAARHPGRLVAVRLHCGFERTPHLCLPVHGRQRRVRPRAELPALPGPVCRAIIVGLRDTCPLVVTGAWAAHSGNTPRSGDHAHRAGAACWMCHSRSIRRAFSPAGRPTSGVCP